MAVDAQTSLLSRFNAHRARFETFYPVWVPFACIVILSSILAYQKLLDLRLSPYRTSQQMVIKEANGTLVRELGYLTRIPRLLKLNPDVRAALDQANALDLERLGQEFSYFSKLSPLISQIRWLDADGNERARINVSAGSPVIVPTDELQVKADRYYFTEALKMPEGHVYVSPIDLNIENNVIVEPFQPTFRAAIKTGKSEGLHLGVLVVNYSLESLLNTLRQISPQGINYQLIDERGYWLINHNRRLQWGRHRDKPELRISEYYPEVWQLLQRQSAGHAAIADAKIWSYSVVPIALSTSPGGHLYSLTTTHADTANHIQFTTRLTILLLCAALLIFGAIIAWRMERARRRERRLSQALASEKAELLMACDDLLASKKRSEALQYELIEARKLSSLGMMVAGVAHELNTPAGGALMSINSLKANQAQLQLEVARGITKEHFDGFMERYREGLRLAEHNVERIIELIKSFRRLAIDRANESVQRFYLFEQVEDLVLSLQPRLEKTNIQIITQIPKTLVLESYPGIISQVLQNLIDNAALHGIGLEGTGKIWIKARPLEGNDLIIQVKDNGRGIDLDIQKQIFDPFVTSGRGKGHTGLGMHLVYQWVTQELQGKLKIKSGPGGGTQVTIRIKQKMSYRSGSLN
ncbi:ATP-binding protein [Marinobacter sp. BGYM27]|uniref:sensor histidine kinase n=1 Tax=unclassified Marinobacter TaxID=83889 RepID=UPI0021A3ABB3|nr:ATP-binding protein [Marinobacter sp. BGYM27]MDG5499523.1 ATP-binding protein [Marinobacter sp. BGYM27]